MKTNMTKPIIAIATLMLGIAAFAQQDAEPDDARPDTQPTQNNGAETNAELSAEQQQAVSELIQNALEAQRNAENDGDRDTNNTRSQRPVRGQGARGTAGTGSNTVSLATYAAAQNGQTSSSTNLLRLNFRNAPLSMVLDYLSEAAGFTISPNSKVDLKGTITVWANQPVTREQAVTLLHKALGEYHYAATVEGNILNIYVVDASNTEIIPGVENNDFTKVQPSQELVTQIVYVHNVEANQLISSLQPLMPSGTSMSANQGANAIVITDTKSNIRRMVQLVKALDTASVSASTVEVFPLQYADATTLAQVIQQLFQVDSGNSRDRGRGGFFGGFGDRGGGDRGGSSSGSGSAQGRMSPSRVLATADDRSNSLVVSASADQMELVRKIVTQMDVNVDDVTELRVFRLRYADPQETADQLTSLFPDPTSQQNSRSGFRGFGFFGGGDRDRDRNRSSTDPNSRKLRQARVTAVPDPRTSSVIVSAAGDMMGQIADIVEKLDSDPSKQKKVYVIKVENRDPQEVMEELQSVIATDSSAGNLNSSRNNNSRNGSQLNTRQQNNLQNMGNNNNNGNFLDSGNSRGGGNQLR